MSSFSSLGAALAKVGLAPTPDHQPAERPAPPAAPVEPPPRPSDRHVRYAAGLLRLGAGDASALSQRLDRCMNGTGAGRGAWEDWVASRLNALPQRVAKELEALGLAQSLTSKGVPTWQGEAAAVLDALVGGHAQEWLDQARADESAAARLAFPEIQGEETDEDYRARALAWADEQTRGVLARLAPASWGSGPDVDGAINKRIQSRAEQRAAAAQAQAEAEADRALAELQAAIGAGETLAQLKERASGMIWFHSCGEHRRRAYALVACSPQAWAAGEIVDVSQPPTGDPPQGWAALPDRTVALWAIGPRSSAAHRFPLGSALAEIRRRFPANGVLPHPDVTMMERATHLWLRPEGLVPLAGENIPAVISDEPGPAGWAEQQGDRFLWCGPAVYAALTRVLERARTPGSLDVSRVFGAYGRHAEKRFPRLYWSVWDRSSLVVALDDQLGPALDDLALVTEHCPTRAPREAYWLHAEVRPTQAGGMRIAACRGAARAALVTLHGHRQQMSRRATGELPCARSDSPALAVVGSAGSAKHDVVRLVACVSEGRPLLLTSGVGYRLGKNPGEVEKVPGLAEGRPGDAVAI